MLENYLYGPKTPAPQIAKSYWKLPDNAMMKDVLLAVRADEATHRQYVYGLRSFSINKVLYFLLGLIIKWLMLDQMHQIHLYIDLKKNEIHLMKKNKTKLIQLAKNKIIGNMVANTNGEFWSD